MSARVYGTLLRAALAGQTAYRASFALELLGAGLVIAIEFVEVLAVFTQVPRVSGFSFAEVVLIFGLGAVAFALADLVVGSVDGVSRHVREGSFEVFMLRPLSPLGQLAVGEVQLRRLGRLVVAAAALVLALARVEVGWTPARVGLLLVAPLSGAVLFGAFFVASGALSFWLVDGSEVGNALTYGSGYVSQWPVAVLGPVLGRFFTFVVPTAFISYLPVVAILGRDEPLGLPSWLPWATPLATAWAVLAAGLLWRAAVRHYTGAGG
ncbi:MAG TPA: ABC-2 family transporter protein [Mycobacteriales bacterium]